MFDYSFGIAILAFGCLIILSMIVMIILKPATYFHEVDFKIKFGSLIEGINISSG